MDMPYLFLSLLLPKVEKIEWLNFRAPRNEYTTETYNLKIWQEDYILMIWSSTETLIKLYIVRVSTALPHARSVFPQRRNAYNTVTTGFYLLLTRSIIVSIILSIYISLHNCNVIFYNRMKNFLKRFLTLRVLYPKGQKSTQTTGCTHQISYQ